MSMREQPPEELIELMARLHLASAANVQAACSLARRLARDLPLFPSVWVDALVQAGRLTPFQAAEINAGRGGNLKIGPFVLDRRLSSLGYAQTYLAREVETQRTCRLLVADIAGNSQARLPQLTALVERQRVLRSEVLVPLSAAGKDVGRIWLACADEGLEDSRTASDWLLLHGRFSPPAALEIARQMSAGLLELERRGLVHGDLNVQNTLVNGDGRVRLLWPGVRGILRPTEGAANAELPAECFDYLPPERVGSGMELCISGDLFSCGAIWWHLLTGRTPLGGGNSLAKLQAAQTSRIVDVRRFAPDTGRMFAHAIQCCRSRDVQARPASFARLVAALGPATADGGLAIEAYCSGGEARSHRLNGTGFEVRALIHQAKGRIAAAAACLAVLAVLTWPLWRARIGWPIVAKASIPVKATLPAMPQKPRMSAAPPAASAPLASTPAPIMVADPPPERQVAHTSSLPQDLVLDETLSRDPNELPLQSGQCVRSLPGRRCRVEVPAIGWQIRAEDLHFENLDFVQKSAANGSDSAQSARAWLIDLRCQRATFEGCTFSFATENGGEAAEMIAIRWLGTDARRGGGLRTSGRLTIVDSIFSGGTGGVVWQGVGPILLEVENSLALNLTTFVRLTRCPRTTEPAAVHLTHVTLRQFQSVLSAPLPNTGEESGGIAVAANDCVVSSQQPAGIIAVVGSGLPARLLHAIEWSGRNSLLSGRIAVAARQSDSDEIQPLDDEPEAISGLARAAIEFAGPISSKPADSRVINWTGPSQSSQPPGFKP